MLFIQFFFLRPPVPSVLLILYLFISSGANSIPVLPDKCSVKRN